jgi:epoxyqueuosine reductase
MTNLKDELKEEASRYGVDLFGVASANDLSDAPPGHRPTDILPGAKSIIILGLKMLDAQTDLLPLEGDTSSNSPRQAMFSGHNTFLSQQLDTAGYRLSRLLEKKGFHAYHQLASTGGIDGRYLTGLLSLKHIAAKAGIGVIGRSSLLITPSYGPRVRLTAVVTDAVIDTDEPLQEDYCSACPGLCISQCPANSLEEPSPGSPYQINRFACNQYLNTRPTCSICLKVCPIGDKRIR